MKDQTEALSRSATLAAKGGALLQKRLKLAEERFTGQVREIYERFQADMTAQPVTPWSLWQSGYDYALDAAQRSVLFWDTLRQRGNNFVEHERAGKPPVLHFDYETVLDGRTLERPVNYALVRIVPPEGVDGRREAPSLRHHRPARRPRPGHRRLQGRFAGRRRAARRPPGVLRDLLSRARARPDAARRVRRRAGVRAQGARAASGEPQAGDRRQLPGRLGGDDARRLESGRHRSDRDQRRADVVLGRRLARKATATTRCATPAACSAARGSRRSSSDLGNGKFDGA